MLKLILNNLEFRREEFCHAKYTTDFVVHNNSPNLSIFLFLKLIIRIRYGGDRYTSLQRSWKALEPGRIYFMDEF